MDFTSTAPLERLVFTAPSGRSMSYSVVFLERSLEVKLFTSPAYSAFVRQGRLRFRGEVEDIPVELAWQPAKDRGHYAMLSPALCKQLSLRMGSEVTVRFDLIDPERVTIPDDIQRALAARPADAARWAKLTPGKQRALIVAVTSARTDATREKRVKSLFAPLGKMPGARRPPAKKKPATSSRRRSA